MERVSLGSGLEFSQLVYGMWRIADDSDTSADHVARKIQICLDQGISTFDQADIYGAYSAEAILGAALKRHPGLRSQMEIVSKCGIVAPVGRYSDRRVKHYDTSCQHIEASVDQSLSNIGTDYLDLLLIHRPDPLMDPCETGAALDKLVHSGKVRAVGVSNFRPWDWSLLQSEMTSTLVTNQIELSLAALHAFTNGDLAFHQQQGKAVMAWSPLGGGALMTSTSALSACADRMAEEFSVDRAAIAIAFLLRHPANILPVLGTNTPARIADIHKALDVKLTREQWFELYESALGTEVP